MLGPPSLHPQPRSVLKTYGSRGKRAPSHAADTSHQFAWDRLDNERKARLEQARARRAQQSARGTHTQHIVPAAGDDPDAELVAQLYSDPGWDDMIPPTLNRPSLASYASRAGDSPTRSSALRTKPQSIVGPGAGSNNVASGTGLQPGIGGHDRQPMEASNQRQQLPTSSSALSADATAGLHRQVLFQEPKFFQEVCSDDDEDLSNDNSDDEVLFRMPSFHVLQKMKQLPKPRSIEPRVNPFGFEALAASGTEGLYAEKDQVLTPLLPSKESPHLSTSLNPFLDSPTTKKSMDIIHKRAQQLMDLQRRRNFHGAGTDMDVDKAIDTQASPAAATNTIDNSNSSPDIAITESSRFMQDTDQQSTPEPEVSRNQVIQDDCLDLSLGKRMSSIEITPKRILAKQRKMALHDAVSPSVPPVSSFLQMIKEADRSNDGPKVKPLKLFLNRDLPDQEQEDFEYPFAKATQNAHSSPSLKSTSRPLATLANRSLTPSANSTRQPLDPLLSSARRSSALVAPSRPHVPKFRRRRSPQQDSRFVAVDLDSLRQDALDEMANPFIDSSLSTFRKPSLKANSSIPTLDKTRPLRQRLPSPTLLPLVAPAVQQPAQNQIPPEQTLLPRALRPIRSLKRPPSVLVNNRKSVFRPTVEDLLSICDQSLFSQFHSLDTSSYGESSGQFPSRTPEILNFDTLLPEHMVGSLTKIGEASYSEVYTVDLPINQGRKHRHGKGSTRHTFINHDDHEGNSKDDDEFEQFQTSKINMYIKESAKDVCLDPQDTGKLDTDSATTKLVMKVMPFYNNEEGKRDTGDQERGRRTKGRPRTDSTVLALEDIYREAMVSTQIMNGWEGFIDKYTKDQLYCIIVLPYGGVDLEHCPLSSWKQAWGVLTQVAASLESKEQAPFWFEHRDLHWGNILVKRTRQDRVVFSRRDLISQRYDEISEQGAGQQSDGSRESGRMGLCRNIPTCGIIVQLIDFTLARVQGDKGNLIYMDLEKDQDLFRGQGDYQFEIYRKMRKEVSKDWAASCPRTNLFWLHYIADKLLTEKDLAKPKSSAAHEHASSSSSSSTSAVMTERWCYERVLAVSRMNLDRLDPSGKTPSATVLDLLLLDQPFA
ncbi:hypothetical protein BGZ99_008242 [Dissophora globulifera]|uniref:non-specific serine/threonine protein kinase n=1 Tax=Dissophora globulifera TaxID=979702 RepID=A0A9P6RS69_9FUNG|nr:hypothetical protein BGZ99_008242 [Dissophora globulifera]